MNGGIFVFVYLDEILIYSKLIQKVPKDVIDEALKNSGSVCEPKWHNTVVEMADRGVKCGLPLLSCERDDRRCGGRALKKCMLPEWN